eukprot:5161053-Pleurochrysis_carterae.AAC.2
MKETIATGEAETEGTSKAGNCNCKIQVVIAMSCHACCECEVQSAMDVHVVWVTVHSMGQNARQKCWTSPTQTGHAAMQ